MGRLLPGLVALVWAGVAQAESLPRVASASVCADQYVLAVADREQIVALSPQAHLPHLSVMAEAAAGLPRVRPSAESYLALGVDVVVANAWADTLTMSLLERFGVQVVRLPLVDELAAVAAINTLVAEALGHPERGEALTGAMLRDRGQPGAGRQGLYMRPGGGTAAAGSFVDALMVGAGLTNHATAEGLSGWTRYDLERFVSRPPELLVTSFFDSPDRSLARAFGDHPAYTRRAATLPQVEVPGAQWVCSGWILGLAADTLTRGLAP